MKDLTILGQNSRQPDPIVLDPPPDPDEANAYYEALEGMLVRASGVAVSPISKYGETNLVLAKHDLERVMPGGATGLLITLDEGSWVTQHDDRSTLPFSITTSDQVEAALGPLAYTFGQYKIEPLSPPTVIPGDFERGATLIQTGPAGFSLAAFNVENFIDDKDPKPGRLHRHPGRPEYFL